MTATAPASSTRPPTRARCWRVAISASASGCAADGARSPAGSASTRWTASPSAWTPGRSSPWSARAGPARPPSRGCSPGSSRRTPAHPARWQRGARSGRASTRAGADGVPGSVRVAQPGASGPAPPGPAAADPSPGRWRCRRQRRRPAPARGPVASRPVRRQVSARALRWPASAGGDRPHARGPPPRPARRRARVDARRLRPARRAQPARRPRATASTWRSSTSRTTSHRPATSPTRIVVMYAGQVVESAPSVELTDRPAHPYTQLLLSAAPDPDRATPPGWPGSGAPPSLLAPPSGCRFHPRCPHAMDICAASHRRASRVAPAHAPPAGSMSTPPTGNTGRRAARPP